MEDIIAGAHAALTQPGSGQILTFLLAGEEYGVEILRVQEIRGWDGATQIPNLPIYVKGVINLRGTIVPIVDLRRRFNLESVPYGPKTVVIVMKVEGGEKSWTLGIVVDAVSDVVQVAEAQMKPPPDFGAAARTDFVRGLVTSGEKLVIALDIDRLLSPSEMTPLKELRADH